MTPPDPARELTPLQAAKEANKLPKADDLPKGLSAEAFTIIQDHDGIFRRKFCFHCEDPACASVCPVTAMHKTADGGVVYDGSKCIGCRYCMVACPHSIPRYDWGSPVPTVRKCIMCYTRLAEGKPTACAEACAYRATNFGTYDDMVAEAHRRIRENPGSYVNHIYGLNEYGGSQVIYLASVPFENLGFKTNVTEQPLPNLSRSVLSMLPSMLGVGGVMMLGTWWIINRRMTVEQERVLEAKLDAEAKSEVKR